MAKFKVGEFIYEADIYVRLNGGTWDLSFYLIWQLKNEEAKILELCCGTGRLTIPIAKKGYHITGVDISHSMLDRAKEKGKGIF